MRFRQGPSHEETIAASLAFGETAHSYLRPSGFRWDHEFVETPCAVRLTRQKPISLPGPMVGRVLSYSLPGRGDASAPRGLAPPSSGGDLVGPQMRRLCSDALFRGHPRSPMAILTYVSRIASLDGYVEDVQGKFDWVAPDEEVHAFVNDLERPVGTYLYGRRMYETMAYWETDDDRPLVYQDYAEIWRAAEKVVYSRTLQTISSKRTRIEREFDADVIKATEGEFSVRHRHRWSGARGPGHLRRAGRRVPPLPRAGFSWWWQARLACRGPCRARVVGRAPVS